MVRYKYKGRKSKAPPKEIFDMQYYDMNISAEELAKIYGVKLHTIYNWATMYRKIDKEKEIEE